MYTEEFDELSEAAENRPQRTYVSTGGNQDLLKIQRENERLKKSLEKEQFFNRLLDQELKDLKSSVNAGTDTAQQFNSRSQVSRGAYNTLLVICLALAGFIAYTLFYNKQYNLFSSGNETAESRLPASTAPAVTDSVPNIIADNKTTSSSPLPKNNLPAFREENTGRQSTAANNTGKPKAKNQQIEQPDAEAAQPAQSSNQAVKPVQQPAAASQNSTAQNTPAQNNIAQQNTPAPVTSTQPAAAQQQPAAPAEKTVVGKYMVTSKANFYSAPDENTLRSYFISPGNDKVVNALDDKNGFIYVEFKNDVGYTTKGWLSKGDLTKQ